MMNSQYLNKHEARNVFRSRAVITGSRRVAIDVRVSTEHEQQMNALENQIQWAKELGLIIKIEFLMLIEIYMRNEVCLVDQ